jgi:hypothetical protein
MGADGDMLSGHETYPPHQFDYDSLSYDRCAAESAQGCSYDPMPPWVGSRPSGRLGSAVATASCESAKDRNAAGTIAAKRERP